MADWLLIFLLILTIYRLTRLIVEDSFPPIGVPRTWLINWWDPDPEWLVSHPSATPHWGAFGRSLRYLATCPWCMSIWLGGGLVWALDEWWRPIPAPLLVIAAGSALTGLMSTLEEKLSS